MKLDCLAGGKMSFFQIICSNGICNKFQFFLCHTAACHAQTQHACLSALLRVASVQSGKALVGIFTEFSCIKGCRFFPESRNILFPVVVISDFHISPPDVNSAFPWGAFFVSQGVISLKNIKTPSCARCLLLYHNSVFNGTNAWTFSMICRILTGFFQPSVSL